jgi:glycosyltransferase involved in cell wall biosynthesis
MSLPSGESVAASAPGAGHRLAVVLSHPTQYYSPWFRWLRSHHAVELRVFYLWEFGVTAQRDPRFQITFKWDVDLLSGYDYELVPNVSRAPGAESFWGFNNPEIPRRLSRWRPTAVLLFGYKWVTHLRVFAWTRWHGVPLLFRGDSHYLGRGVPPLRTRLPLRLLYAQFAAVLCVGEANRSYFSALGVPPRKLFFAPHSVNSAFFEPADPTHRAAAAALRAELRIPPAKRVVLYAGKLVAEKNPRELVEAFLKLRPADAVLVIVGDGPEKNTLLELTREASEGSIRFLPFANQSEMPARYLVADLLVLPSRGHYETWGLAVNEAMHLGTPVLVSDLVGCQRDLVTDGETGWVFRANEPGALQSRLAAALATLARPAEVARIKASVAARIARYTYAETTVGLLAALASLPPPRKDR